MNRAVVMTTKIQPPADCQNLGMISAKQSEGPAACIAHRVIKTGFNQLRPLLGVRTFCNVVLSLPFFSNPLSYILNPSRKKIQKLESVGPEGKRQRRSEGEAGVD